MKQAKLEVEVCDVFFRISLYAYTSLHYVHLIVNDEIVIARICSLLQSGIDI